MLREEYVVRFFEDIDSFYSSDLGDATDGIDQSPFQYENWQRLIYEEYTCQKMRGKYIGAILYKGNMAKIGGHFFSKNTGKRKGVFFLTAATGQTDYSDLIYFSGELHNNEITYFIDEVLRYTEQKSFYIDRVKEDSPLNIWAQSKALCSTAKTVCAHVNINGEYEQYWKELSKSTRQNIRTAKNRLTKDGLKYEIVSFDCEHLDHKTSKELMRIYEARKRIKNKGFSIRKLLLNILRSFRNKRYHLIENAMTRLTNVFCSYIVIDGKIAGYFFGLKAKNNYAVIMQVAFDEEMKKYSPGMILLSDSIENFYSSHTICQFDLATGDEQYKFNLGAKEHYTNNYIYCI